MKPRQADKKDGGGRKKKRMTGRKVSSASSNPQIKKFRSQATAKLVSKAAVVAAGNKKRVDAGGKGQRRKGAKGPRAQTLTAAALHEHEEEQDDGDDGGAAAALARHADGVDEEDGVDPFASVRQKWNSQLESDKEVCAVLAAVTESIAEQGGEETPTAYWGTLMTTLEGADADQDEKAITAVVYLLALVSTHVPDAIVLRQFSEASAVFLGVLTAYAESGSQALVKATLTCLGSLLVAHDTASWGATGATKVYRPLLAFSVDSRPKIRKAAHAAVHAVATRNAAHPALAVTAGFCRKELRDETSAPHILNLLQRVLSTLPVDSMEPIIADLFRLIASGDARILGTCFSVLTSLFNSGTDRLPVELLSQTIEQLFDNQPSVSNALHRAEWNSVVGTGCGMLATRDPAACCTALPHYIQELLPGYGSDHKDLIENVTQCLHGVVDACVRPLLEVAESEDDLGHLAEVAAALQGGLKLRYQARFPEVLGVVENMFDALGPSSETIMADILESLVQLRSTDSIRCVPNIERAVGAAVSAMGIEAFIRVIEMDLASDEPKSEFATAWLLPVFKATLTGGQLAYFAQTVMPLAVQLHEHHTNLVEAGEDEVAAVYRTLFTQVWDLFPTFCAQATDVADNFRRIVRTLRSVLENHPELQGTVCTSLASLITSDVRTEEDLVAVGAFGKNMLPTLFTLYCEPATADSTRARCLAAIEAYVGITPAQILTDMMQTVFDKLATAEEGRTHQDLMDLCIVMAASVGDAGELFGMLTPLITSENSTMQKKAYKALLMLCSSEKEEHRSFVSEKIEEIVGLVQASVVEATPAAKYYRMSLIAAIVRALPPDAIGEFLPEVMPEIIMCTKEVNERARASAYACLVDVGATVGQLGEENAESGVTFGNYFNMVVAGLGGSGPHMQSATILALSRLVYEYHSEIPQEDIHTLFGAIIALLESRAREVVKSALGFVKVAIVLMDTDELGPHLPELLPALVQWSGPAFRLKVKMIFERLVRKFDVGTIKEHTPEDHHRLIANIRRSKEREKRKKGVRAGADADDFDDAVSMRSLAHKPSYEDLIDDSDDEERVDSGGRGPQLREGLDGDAVDLLNPSTDGGSRSSGKPSSIPYKLADDGRWIIPNEENDDDAEAPSIGTAAASASTHRERTGFAASFGSRKMKKDHARDDDGSDDEGESSAVRRISKPAIGKMYRAKKAGGDIKLKNKPDPYAYVAFDPSRLNRRKRAKATGEFKGMMKAAKKGAARGATKGHKNKRK